MNCPSQTEGRGAARKCAMFRRRFLASTAVEAANSGNPGQAVGWRKIVSAVARGPKHNPATLWPDRDRLYLSMVTDRC